MEAEPESRARARARARARTRTLALALAQTGIRRHAITEWDRGAYRAEATCGPTWGERAGACDGVKSQKKRGV